MRASYRILPAVLSTCLLSCGCARQDYSYHLRFWEWYCSNADQQLQQQHYSEAKRLLIAALREAKGLGSTDIHRIISLRRLAELDLLEGEGESARSLYKQILQEIGTSSYSSKPYDLIIPWEQIRSLLGLAELCERSGDKAGAESCYKQALAVEMSLSNSRRLPSADIVLGRDIAMTLCGLANARRDEGDNQSAEAYYKQALSLAKATAAPASFVSHVISEYSKLLAVMNRQSDLQELQIELCQFQPINPDKQSSQSSDSLWWQYCRAGAAAIARHRWSEAEDNLALALQQCKHFSEHDARLAKTLEVVGTMQMFKRDTRGAEAVLLKALQLMQSSPTTSARDLAIAYRNVGYLLFCGKNSPAHEAKPYYEASLRILAREFNEDDLYMSEPAYQLASIYFITLERAESERLSKKRIEIIHKWFGPNNPALVDSYNLLGRIRCGQGRLSQAEEAYDTCLSILHTDGMTKDRLYLEVLSQNAKICMDQRKYKKASELYRQSILLAEKLDGPLSALLERLLKLLAQSLAAQGNFADAMTYMKKTSAIAERTLSPTDPELLDTQLTLAQYSSRLKLEDAMTYIRKAATIAEKIYPSDDTRYSDAQRLLAEYSHAIGKLEESNDYYQRFASGCEKKLGCNVESVIETCILMAEQFRQLGKLPQARQVCQQELEKLQAQPPTGSARGSKLRLMNTYTQILRESNMKQEADANTARANVYKAEITEPI